MNFTNAATITKELAIQTEAIMLDQLGDLVTSGLLVWESTDPVLVMDYATNKLRISQLGRLRLRDQEGFDRLKSENEALKKRLEAFQSAIADAEKDSST